MKTAALILFTLIPSLTFGQGLERTHLIGTANADRAAAWNGHIEYASWLDDETIVYWRKTGELTCWSLTNKKAVWSLQDVHNVSDWSVCRNKGRLAILYKENADTFSDKRVQVINCVDGKALLNADATALAMLMGTDHALPTRIALTPTDAKLILCNFGLHFASNGYVICPNYKKLELSFRIDASPSELSVSPNGSRVTVLADTKVICIHDIQNDTQVYFRGDRIRERPDSITSVIDAPFMSHARHDGADILIYTIDNSWSTGKVFIRDLKTNNGTSFDARNGHIEIDVDFARKRVVLTGTSAGLALLKFDGSVLAHMPKATLQRNACVAFSPSGKQLLIGSWDNTVSVFEIGE
ncbi:MAG: hypothetical protein ABJZ55_13750 [Fuerstiella sp.]